MSPFTLWCLTLAKNQFNHEVVHRINSKMKVWQTFRIGDGHRAASEDVHRRRESVVEHKTHFYSWKIEQWAQVEQVNVWLLNKNFKRGDSQTEGHPYKIKHTFVFFSSNYKYNVLNRVNQYFTRIKNRFDCSFSTGETTASISSKICIILQCICD